MSKAELEFCRIAGMFGSVGLADTFSRNAAVTPLEPCEAVRLLLFALEVLAEGFHDSTSA